MKTTIAILSSLATFVAGVVLGVKYKDEILQKTEEVQKKYKDLCEKKEAEKSEDGDFEEVV